MNKHTLTSTLTAVLISALAAATLPALTGSRSATEASSDAARAFETFKGLAGVWKGENGKGDPVSITYEVLAADTTVLERFVHGGEEGPTTMLTVYHLDGDDLMLTHYCMAGNQPRMRAAAYSANEVDFELVDVTGLASPEAGHMHRASYEFHGQDRFATAWTWREAGADKFTEKVEVQRVK